MDQVIVLSSMPVLFPFDAWAISYQWQLWIKMLTIKFSSTSFQLKRFSYSHPRRTSRTTTTGWEWRSSEFFLSLQSAVSTSGFSWRSDQNLKYVGGKISPKQHHLGGGACLEMIYQVRQRRRRRGREERLTLVLIAIVTTFLICSLPRFYIGGCNIGYFLNIGYCYNMQPAQVQYRRV